MDRIIIVFIPVKKNVSVLLKLIAVVKVRRLKYEQAKVVDIICTGQDDRKWPMLMLKTSDGNIGYFHSIIAHVYFKCGHFGPT